MIRRQLQVVLSFVVLFEAKSVGRVLVEVPLVSRRFIQDLAVLPEYLDLLFLSVHASCPVPVKQRPVSVKSIFVPLVDGLEVAAQAVEEAAPIVALPAFDQVLVHRRVVRRLPHITVTLLIPKHVHIGRWHFLAAEAATPLARRVRQL